MSRGSASSTQNIGQGVFQVGFDALKQRFARR